MKRIKYYEKDFDKDIDELTNNEKYRFIRQHSWYWTMNPWNREISYSHNVKIYNLPLSEMEKERLYDELDDGGLYSDLTLMIYGLIKKEGLSLFFNGRSSGYILVDDNGWDIFKPGELEEEDWEGYIKTCISASNEFICEDETDWTFEEMEGELQGKLNETFDFLLMFDRMCDSILNWIRQEINK